MTYINQTFTIPLWIKVNNTKAWCLTTIMAILPPTSPTTVMGGFSFAIITKRHRWRMISILESNCSLSCNPDRETPERFDLESWSENLQTCKTARPQKSFQLPQQQSNNWRFFISGTNLCCCQVKKGLIYMVCPCVAHIVCATSAWIYPELRTLKFDKHIQMFKILSTNI